MIAHVHVFDQIVCRMVVALLFGTEDVTLRALVSYYAEEKGKRRTRVDLAPLDDGDDAGHIGK